MNPDEIRLLAIYLLFAVGTFTGLRGVDDDPKDRITPAQYIFSALAWPVVWIALGFMALCNLANEKK